MIYVKECFTRILFYEFHGFSLIFMSLIHVYFIFVYGVRKYSNFILLHVTVQFSQYHLLKKLFSPLFILVSFVDDWFCCLVTKSCPTILQPLGLMLTRLLCPWDFPGKNMGEGCHLLLQGIFLTQKWNLYLLYWQADYLPLSHQRSPCCWLTDHKCMSLFLYSLFCFTDLHICFLCQYHAALITVAF